MYLGSFSIDDYVGIPAATHRFSSGAAYAPTLLTYSIYEEATAVGIDEDVDMVPASPFDALVGCYWVRRQLTAAAGFEAGKNYVVVVKATVDSISAIQMHTFQLQAAVRVADKTGFSLSPAGVQSIWDALTSALTTVGSVGKRIADNLDAAVTSRSTYAGADTAGTTSLLSRLTSGRATNLDNLDAAVSTRSTYAGADTAGTTTLLSRIASALTITGGKVDVNDKTGFSLSSAGIQAIWDALTSAMAAVGSVGKRIADYLDAAVSSRSTYAGTDTAGTATLLSRLTSGRATNLDNLDAAVSSRSTVTAAQVRSEMDANSAKLDVSVGTRLAAAGYTAPPTAAENADAVWDEARAGHVTAGTFGNYLDSPVSGAGGGGAPTAAQIADAVWDEPSADHVAAGSTGARLNAAASGGVDYNEIAAAILKYNLSGITGEARRSLINAIRVHLNKISVNETTNVATVYKEDDTTPAFVMDLSLNSRREITGVDPE